MRLLRSLSFWLIAVSLVASPALPRLVQVAVASSRPGIEPQQALAIIVNRSNPVENLSSGELRKIFMGERSRWPSGHRVVVTMMQAGNSEREVILRQVYDMNENGYRDYFFRRTYTGDIPVLPKTLSSPTILRKFVFNTPGAIGYLRASEVDESVKVVAIDGRLPEDFEYRFRIEEPAK